MMKYLYLLPLLFLFSCQDKAKKEMLIEIEEMQVSLDSLSELADHHRIDTLLNLIEYVKLNTKEVVKYYYADTVDYSVANMMNDYKETRKAFSKNSGNLAKVRQAIPEVKESLENLSHDITHGVGQREKYEGFVAYERGKISQIKELLTYYIETKEKYTALFIETDEKVLSFIEQLKSDQ